MFIPLATKTMILEDLQKPNADVSKIARAYGYPARLIRELICIEPSTASFAETNSGRGRPEMEKYFVSRTLAGSAWPESDRELIEQKRLDYDNGLIEMCQGRDGNWIILYAIPRTQPDFDRRLYFTAPPEE